MEISALDNTVAVAMTDLFGSKIFKYWNDNHDGTITVRLNDNVILKCYGFDRSVKVELGGKMFILENNSFAGVVIE